MTTQEIITDTNLRFCSDKKPGFTRKVSGDVFQYFDTKGERITDEKIIDRINKLVIPPAYKDVWICPYANGYLQATGYDAKKRKQYRYHPRWNKVSQEDKFTHLLEFARKLPSIRRKVKEDLALPRMPRQKVIAAVIWLLEKTLIRVGNEEYEKENKSYGLTTLKNRHVDVVDASKISFHFKGKSGVYHNVSFRNKKVAAIVRKCKDLPGQDLFEYKDEDGEIQSVSSNDVNDYLKEISGIEISAKDFRTWGGTLVAASAFDRCGVCDEETEAKKNILETTKKVASHLRNKPATSRKYYIHPGVISAYEHGTVLSSVRKRQIEGLDDNENKVVALLETIESS